MEEIIYFELNNWFCGRDYPNDEPFISWLSDDCHQKFRDNDWVTKNELCVVFQILDMSQNYLITAKKSWVEENCPKLLTDYKEFLRFPKEEDDDTPVGRTDYHFLPYEKENFGVTEGPEY